VPGLEAEHFDPQALGPDAERLGDAFPERLVVVQDIDVLDRRELLALSKLEGLAQEQVCRRRSLVVVARGDADVVALPGRVVDAGFARVVPGRVVRQADVRVRNAEHPERAAGSPVRKRDDQLRATRVERPENAHHRGVRRVGPTPRRAFTGIPTAGLGRRVVATLVADRVLADLEVVLLVEYVLDRLLHVDVLR